MEEQNKKLHQYTKKEIKRYHEFLRCIHREAMEIRRRKRLLNEYLRELREEFNGNLMEECVNDNMLYDLTQIAEELVDI
eukprot:SAG31_NODE_985_length_10549_cov_2.605339_2_plen_79_part_00